MAVGIALGRDPDRSLLELLESHFVGGIRLAGVHEALFGNAVAEMREQAERVGTHWRRMLEFTPVRKDGVVVGWGALVVQPHGVVDAVVVVALRDVKYRRYVGGGEVDLAGEGRRGRERHCQRGRSHPELRACFHAAPAHASANVLIGRTLI